MRVLLTKASAGFRNEGDIKEMSAAEVTQYVLAHPGESYIVKALSGSAREQGAELELMLYDEFIE